MTDGNEMSADPYEPYDAANRRHIGPSPDEIAEMLRVVGVSSLDALIDETVPKDIRLGKALDFDRPASLPSSALFRRSGTDERRPNNAVALIR
jgi:glycine cleavage system pyridoxal-binding protein P